MLQFFPQCCGINGDKIEFLSKADYPRMRAFSYAWSLPVTWQKWWSHHSIRRYRKTHAARTHTWLYCRTGVICRWKFYIAGIEIFELFWSLWPSYTNLTRIPWRYTACANMNFLHQGFRKLSSDGQTHIHTDREDETLYTTRLRGWSNTIYVSPGQEWWTLAET